MDGIPSNVVLGVIYTPKGTLHFMGRSASGEPNVVAGIAEARRQPPIRHPRAGYARRDHDTRRTLRYPEVLNRANHHAGVFTFDLAADGRE